MVANRIYVDTFTNRGQFLIFADANMCMSRNLDGLRGMDYFEFLLFLVSANVNMCSHNVYAYFPMQLKAPVN